MANSNNIVDKSIGGIIEGIGHDDTTPPTAGDGDDGTVHWNRLFKVPQPVIDLANGAAPAPGAHASTHKDGGSDEVATSTATPNAIPKATGTGKLSFGWMPVGTTAGTIAEGGSPGSHAAQHKNGGSDEVATATAAANEIPKAGGTGKLAIGWLPVGTTAGTVAAGDDTRFTEAGLVAHKNKHKQGGTDAFTLSDNLNCNVLGFAVSAYYSD